MARLSAPTPAPAAPDSRRWMGWVLAVGVFSALLAVGVQRLGGGLVPDDAGPARWQARLHFEDRPNGDIGVLNAAGQEVACFTGEQGFMRTALRTLARERLRRGLGPQAPFELTAHANGRLSLSDPSTGVRIALESFGPAQVAAFTRLKAIASSPTQGNSP